jgi:uncharacterized protein (DUF169 family)
MSSFPNFKSQQHHEDYVGIFKERVENYIALMNIVKDEMYGIGAGNYSNLPGTCQEVLLEITRSIMYDTSTDFKEVYTEYKDDDTDYYIPYKDLKDRLRQALQEIENEPPEFNLGDK